MNIIKQELEDSLVEIQALIDSTKASAVARDCDPYAMVLPSGALALQPLLVAKAEILSALVRLRELEPRVSIVQEPRPRKGRKW